MQSESETCLRSKFTRCTFPLQNNSAIIQQQPLIWLVFPQWDLRRITGCKICVLEYSDHHLRAKGLTCYKMCWCLHQQGKSVKKSLFSVLRPPLWAFLRGSISVVQQLHVHTVWHYSCTTYRWQCYFCQNTSNTYIYNILLLQQRKFILWM